MEQFLLQLFIFFTASAIAVPIAKKLGLSPILGYLTAGIIIGPYGFSMIKDLGSVMHFTEFGVVMMLFLVGLELKPSLLWSMRLLILAVGGAQVVLTTLLIGSVVLIYLPWQQSLTIGMIFALSSTAIVLQTLKEKGLMNTNAGKSIFSVLLFQDLAVIPMLAIIPMLSHKVILYNDHSNTIFFNIKVLPSHIQFLIIILAIFVVFLFGRYVSRPLFRVIAETRIRELFIGAALAMVVGISLLMTLVGLSPALGTFLAGVVLSDSEYRHELESDIEPFKGLLLGIFFISIGASLNFLLIQANLLVVLGITLSLIVLKFTILFSVSKFFKMSTKEGLLFSFFLAQGGEFAFVLLQFAKNSDVLNIETTEILVASVAISMFLAPFVFKLHDIFFENEIKKPNNQQIVNPIDKHERKVILAGFGEFGTDMGRLMLSAGIKPIILDHDISKVEVLRKFGFEVYYGDVSRIDLLESAGASDADLLILTMNDIEVVKKLITQVSKHYPNLKIVANASKLSDVHELIDMNVAQVRRASLGGALMLGQDVLQLLGMDPYDAHRLVRIFKNHDVKMINELHNKRDEGTDSYISGYKKQMQSLEDLIKMDLAFHPEEIDKAWTATNPEI